MSAAIEDFVKLPIDDRAEQAMQRAVARLLKEQAAKGETVCVERNGKVEHVLASQILAEHPEIEEVLQHGRNDGR
jgi:hypothetical protein